ncbi:MAG: DNA circularization N-terminal domain-containing protein [Sodalis sp. (in: enterobacteria)]|uniref:DNA circularization N-terminal domain-containing protein n=1 Tax=Sodalis sp. (in: enterobacteria) TaxID=1898979 RepID=UPI003F33BF2E
MTGDDTDGYTIYPLFGQLGVDMLLPASFRDIAFDCLYTREVLAHDTVVYVGATERSVEDHGLKALGLRLSALFWGNGYQTRLKAFLAALKVPGPAVSYFTRCMARCRARSYWKRALSTR